MPRICSREGLWAAYTNATYWSLFREASPPIRGELVRLLKKQGAAVRVVLSRGATEFITPLTMQALSGEPTHTELLDEEAEAGMGHIELARWADLMIVAPATADVIARLAQGRQTICSPPLRSQRLHRLP